MTLPNPSLSEIRELRQLRAENARLKRLAADLTLQTLQDAVKKERSEKFVARR
jgi:hypothetical protein